MKIENFDIEYKIGDLVYLVTDVEQYARLITGIGLRANNNVTYCLAFGTIESWHYPLEISADKDFMGY